MLKKKAIKLLSTILGFSVILNIGNNIVSNKFKQPKNQLSQSQIGKVSLFGAFILMLIAGVKRFRTMSTIEKTGCVAALLLGATVLIFGFGPIVFLVKSIVKYCVASVADLLHH